MANSEIGMVRALLAQNPLGDTLGDIRATYDRMGAMFPTPADAILRKEPIGDVAGEWTTTPEAIGDRTILYLHGGGYTSGSIQSHRALVVALGRASKARTLAIDYRLAPEHPFPAGLQDAVAGYRFLLNKGIAPASIAVAGDSAGGGLAVAALVAMREQGLPQPACGFCISPWVDLEVSGGSANTKAAEDPIAQRDLLRQMAAAYLAGTKARDPAASPIHANLRGLAPLLIQVGSAEVLLDDAVRLASAAGAQEVECRLEIWPEMIHVWHYFFPMLGEARRAIATAGGYISDRLGPS